MRGKVTDQDLTNYALNELAADERIYVESMLVLSEECRNDIYQMIELSEMLKEGCEAEDEKTQPLLLSDEQRAAVLSVPHWNWRSLLQRAAAVAIFASGTAYTASRLPSRGHVDAADKLASASQAVQSLADDLKTKSFAQTAAEFTARIQQSTAVAAEWTEWQFVATPAVCTPPVWSDISTMPDIVEM